MDSLEAAYSEDCRAVLIVNPNNPTGSYLTPEEMESLVRFCGERDLALISDEVFFEFPLTDSDQLPADRRDICSAIAAPPEALVFTLGGLSKLLALPQLKLGWIVTGGPDHLVRAALERLDLISDTYLSVNTPVQHAATVLLTLADDIQEPIRRRCARNLAVLKAAAGTRHDVSIPDVAAGWYAVLGVDTDISEEDLVFELLDEKNVLAHPGFFFDFSEGSHLVLSLLTPEDAFREGVTRVLAHLDR
ncbi:MAG: aminotransferase class I/II-fold pyridoxal phosphate-dependent enzyme [Ignavibacteria bacterium]|nr:aminotransferase class I/II-fold pyridoxal phosphate-dependent enzyme [Ignavibacteria bacterium]